MQRRTGIVSLLLLLGACATMRHVDSDVSTYSQWPADRKPATYTFERLPSQQARAEQQQRLEDTARAAIEAAGFTPVVDAKDAEVAIQVGARVSPSERSIYDDPLWWRGGLYGHWRRGYYVPYWGWGAHVTPSSYEREVAILVRDRKTGQALYESRAVNSGGSSITSAAVLAAMYAAALKDFPHAGVNPRRVSIATPP
jgi:Domain of unknown function (DUF4136)